MVNVKQHFAKGKVGLTTRKNSLSWRNNKLLSLKTFCESILIKIINQKANNHVKKLDSPICVSYKE